MRFHQVFAKDACLGLGQNTTAIVENITKSTVAYVAEADGKRVVHIPKSLPTSMLYALADYIKSTESLSLYQS